MKGYQLKITIKGSSPPIWRRVIVPEKISFGDLDDIIEYIFGWTHDHLYEFYIPKEDVRFAMESDWEEEDAESEAIDTWFYEKAVIRYIYDFGDNWEHTILVEKMVDYQERFPQVVKFKGPNMIEDCGGIWGFYDYIEEAEPFEMERINQKLKEDMVLPEFIQEESGKAENEVMEEAIFDEDSEFYTELEALTKFMEKKMQIQNHSKKQLFLEKINLADVFLSYKKDWMIEIARENGFSGCNKFKKAELAEWLKNHFLETEFMKKVLEDTEREEIEILEEAMEEGIQIPVELVVVSRLLTCYCAYTQGEMLLVPEDVKEKYRKINTEEFQKKQERRWKIQDYCRSTKYLYGVLPVSDIVTIYKMYENDFVTEEEIIETCRKLGEKGEGFLILDGYLMAKELEEEDSYREVLENHEGVPYYMPNDTEEFLDYGRMECQEPDTEDMALLEFLEEEMDEQEAYSLIIFYKIQELIRLNYNAQEIMDNIPWNQEFRLAGKRRRRLAALIEETAERTRNWDDKGFTPRERQEYERQHRASAGNVLSAEAYEAVRTFHKIVPFVNHGKIYPNDRCPCGSGKKYKHCCGRKKE